VGTSQTGVTGVVLQSHLRAEGIDVVEDGLDWLMEPNAEKGEFGENRL
jgi:hypothetical protein